MIPAMQGHSGRMGYGGEFWLTNCGSLEKGLANHFSSHSVLENPMNSMKGQK